MDTWDAIRARRNVRDFADQPISPADLDRVLEAGRRAPSASNKQWWDLIVVTDRNQLTQLAATSPGASYVADAPAAVALVVPLPTSDRQTRLIEYDLGQLTIQMMLAAADLGIGSGHASIGDQDVARDVLGFPDDRRCPYVIAFGYPAERALRPIAQPNRRSFDHVVHRDRW